jgi:hypothetical protein
MPRPITKPRPGFGPAFIIGGKTPNADALKLLEAAPDLLAEVPSLPPSEPAFPNEFGDLIYLHYNAGSELMEGMKYSPAEDCYYFYSEPEELLKRLADLKKRAELKEPGVRTLNLKEIERFVALYKAAFKDKTDWEPISDELLPPRHDELIIDEDDALKEDLQITIELVGEELIWGDPKVLGPLKQKPAGGEFHREPVIVLHF